jgi:hypothetical protein
MSAWGDGDRQRSFQNPVDNDSEKINLARTSCFERLNLSASFLATVSSFCPGGTHERSSCGDCLSEEGRVPREATISADFEGQETKTKLKTNKWSI